MPTIATTAYTQPQGKTTALSSSKKKGSGMVSYHQHEEFELICLLSGQGRCYMGGQVYALQPEHVYILPANALHMMQYDVNQPHSMYHIYFRQELLTELEQTYRVNLQPCLCSFFALRTSSELQARLDYALSVHNRRSNGALDHAIRQTLVMCVLLTIAKELRSQETCAAEIQHPVIQPLLRYLSENCTQEITLDDLCQRFRLSKNYLCRLFKKTTGRTLMEHLNALRIQQACRLFQQTNLNVSQVCQLSGYNDLTYFGRMFRLYTGQTPSCYMREHRPSP